jgi:hypothetical protein
MKSLSRWSRLLLLPAIALVAIEPALASFSYPLSSEAIREAYFLGKRNDEQTAAFFAKYVHSLPTPKSGPDVAIIGIDTPYSAIVRRVQAAPDDYHAEDAEQEFLGKPGVFGVFVQVFFTASYPDPSRFSPHGTNFLLIPAFWHDFTVRLTQDQEVKPDSREGGPMSQSNAPLDQYGLSGAEIDLDYDAAKIDPSAPAVIEAVTPEGEDVETTFNLSQLR